MMRILLMFATIAMLSCAPTAVEAGWPSWKVWKNQADGCVDSCGPTPIFDECVTEQCGDFCLDRPCVDSPCVDETPCCDDAPRKRLLTGKYLRKSRRWIKRVCTMNDGCIDAGCADYGSCVDHGCVAEGCLDDNCLQRETWFSNTVPEMTTRQPQRQQNPATGTVAAPQAPAAPRALFTEDAPAPVADLTESSRPPLLPTPKQLEPSQGGQIPPLPRIKAPGYVPEEL